LLTLLFYYRNFLFLDRNHEKYLFEPTLFFCTNTTLHAYVYGVSVHSNYGGSKVIRSEHCRKHSQANKANCAYTQFVNTTGEIHAYGKQNSE
jgi:hypothetical protein